MPRRANQPVPANPGGGPRPNPAGPRVPRGAHPEVWRLALALRLATERLPYHTGEARMLDGLARFVRLECTAPLKGVPLAPTGPAWRAVLDAVDALARLASPASARLLAPWTRAGAGPGEARPGFVPGVVDQGDGVG